MARRRKQSKGEKLETNMSAMIDIVFQLLIFFMLTLRIVEPEGDFNVNMPANGAPTDSNEPPPFPDIKVKLKANPDGTLAGLFFGQRNLGIGPGAFEQLNIEILKVIGRPGDPITKDMAVEIDADYQLHFSNVINAVGACSGRIDKRSGNVVKYIEKIKFKPPTPQAAAG
ncbi:MAG: biopolymer transporter ExbD [Rhodopirellula sp.]|nr:biopolymer transporter ExbD [Rhodopirellula sp.]